MKPSDPSAVQRWTTAERYYTLRVQQDLFGQWELLKVWGSLRSRHGRHKVCPAQSHEAAAGLLTREARRRAQRGYRVTPRTGPSDAADTGTLSLDEPGSRRAGWESKAAATGRLEP